MTNILQTSVMESHKLVLLLICVYITLSKHDSFSFNSQLTKIAQFERSLI